MTCIVGLCRDDQIWLAGDSGGFETDSGSIALSRTVKVWRWGQIVFGGAGSYRAIQIIQHWLADKGVSAQFAVHDGSAENFMVTSLLPAMKGLLEEHGFGEVENDHASMDAVFLIGAKGQLFEFQSDYSMISIEAPFHAIGSGRDVAIGALDILNKSKKAPDNLLKEALITAEKYNAFVRRP
jgi:ATP-dependent protease HslVU (ClpYQ) peptidase subunit